MGNEDKEEGKEKEEKIKSELTKNLRYSKVLQVKDNPKRRKPNKMTLKTSSKRKKD